MSGAPKCVFHREEVDSWTPSELADEIERLNAALSDARICIHGAKLSFTCEPCGRYAHAKWIPVGERMPEVGISVLVSGNSGPMVGHYRTSTCSWATVPGMWPIAGVTHWMPLPGAAK